MQPALRLMYVGDVHHAFDQYLWISNLHELSCISMAIYNYIDQALTHQALHGHLCIRWLSPMITFNFLSLHMSMLSFVVMVF